MKKYKSAKVTGIIFAVLIFSLVVNILYLGATGKHLISGIVRQAELPGTKASAMSTSPANRVMSPAGIRSCVRFLRREAVLRPEVLRFLFAMFPKTRSLFYIMKQGALRAALSVTMEEFRYYSILSLYHGKSQMAIYFPSISR